jgi:hypothetical protein
MGACAAEGRHTVQLPFTTEQFLQFFKDFNLAVWPMQILAYVLGVTAVVLSFLNVKHGDRVVAGVLGFFWLFIGGVCHIAFFTKINPAAYLFGAFTLVQGALFLYEGVYRNGLRFSFRPDAYAIVGAVFVLYAMVIYPLIGGAAGHGWPHSPNFGVAPCPTTIFTFGILLWTASPVRKYVVAIPLVWSIIGFTASFKLGILEDVGLLVAGVVGTTLLVVRDRRRVA